MAAVGKFKLLGRSWSVLSRCRLNATTSTSSSVRFISTSKKDKEALTVAEKDPEYLKEVEKFKNVASFEDNWTSHGYNPYDAEDDVYWHHQTMFWTVTVALLGGSFIVAYFPDFRLQHWKLREAYLQIERREALGLPHIDPNFVDSEKMKAHLPSDEELGDTEIII